MKAVILAAGRGSRMREITEDKPKCLVEVDGQTLLDRQILSLTAAGVDKIGIVTGYRREMIANRGLQEFHNPRWEETNMVSSLACASPWLEHDVCLVSYSDIFYPSEAVKLLFEKGSDLAITYDPDWLKLWSKRFDDPLEDAETFQIDDNGYLTEIGNRPSSFAEVHGQYMGLLKITPPGWAEIVRVRAEMSELERDKIHMTGTLQKIIKSARMRIQATPYRGYWGEIDSASDLHFYNS